MTKVAPASLVLSLVALVPITGLFPSVDDSLRLIDDTSSVDVVESPMRYVGFDPEYAIAAGLDVFYEADGIPRLVDFPDLPAMDADQLKSDAIGALIDQAPAKYGDVTTDGVVVGNCGSSYVFTYDIGPKKYSVETGFQTTIPSISYSWKVDVIQPASAYNYTHTWGGALALRTVWGGVAVGTVSNGGWATARASGWSLLSNGLICDGLGPIDSTPVY